MVRVDLNMFCAGPTDDGAVSCWLVAPTTLVPEFDFGRVLFLGFLAFCPLPFVFLLLLLFFLLLLCCVWPPRRCCTACRVVAGMRYFYLQVPNAENLVTSSATVTPLPSSGVILYGDQTRPYYLAFRAHHRNLSAYGATCQGELYKFTTTLSLY
jgi:hypothetical protein